MNFESFRVYEGKEPSELVEGQWYWLAPGLCSEEWLDSFSDKAAEAGARVGFSGYHGSAYEVAVWPKEEAVAKLWELMSIAGKHGFELVMNPIWYSQGILDAADEVDGWEIFLPEVDVE